MLSSLLHAYRGPNHILHVAIPIVAVLFAISPCGAANRVGVALIESGNPAAVDTATPGINYQFQVSLENDVFLSAIQLGFKIYSPEGVTWSWDYQSGGYGPNGPSDEGYVTVVPGCRMDPTGEIWDLTDLLVFEASLDGLSPDTIFPGGVALWNGMPPGPMEPMMLLHLTFTSAGDDGPTGTVCIDSTFVPPGGHFIFVDINALAISPGIDGPFCWTVAPDCPYDSDGDGYGDPGHPENDCPPDNCADVSNPDQADIDGDGIGDACDDCTDSDGDGFGDPGFPNNTCEVDNCPAIHNEDQLNSDADSLGDACDNCPLVDNEDQQNSDTDNHGDLCDNCPTVDNPLQVNSDNDSHGDACDNCPSTDNEDQVNSDSDSHGDVCDNCPTADNEDQQNSDTDSYGDVCDNCPTIDNETQANWDNDSHGDACDNCPLVDNEDQQNSDTDSYGDVCDNCPTIDNETQANSDNDSHGDACDNCPWVDNEDQQNSDTDAYGDACDNCPAVDNPNQTNSDNDSHGDACDNCPNDDNEDQRDSDADGLGDICDACPHDPDNDIDGDGFCGDVDNCPEVFNPGQEDSDGDGLGDACDPPANIVYCDPYLQEGIKPPDTIWAGWDYLIRIWIENGVLLNGMQLGFRIYSPDGATWNWNAQPDGYGPTQVVTVVPGCRMDPTGDIWDMTDLMAVETDIDGLSPDTFLLGGVSLSGGLPAGYLEHMISLHFTVAAVGEVAPVGTICVDSAFVPPAGEFVFVDSDGFLLYPAFDGPYCWPAVWFCPFDGDDDGYGDPGYPENECPVDNCPEIYNPGQDDSDGDGWGDVCDDCTDTDGDGFGNPEYQANTCPPDNCPDIYNPDQADMDDDGLGDACDNDPPARMITWPDPLYTAETYTCDSARIGITHQLIAIGEFTAGHETEDLDPATLIINGDLEADSWGLYDSYGDFSGSVLKLLVPIEDFIGSYPPWDDTVINQYMVAGQFYSGEDFYIEGEFMAIGLISGDANRDRKFDVGDAVFLIGHIFQDGWCPCPPETGDANGDATLNVGDVVYMINHIFRGGPPPTHP